MLISFAAIVICQNQNQRAAAVAVIHTLALVPSHTSEVILVIHAIVHCQRAPKTDITPDQAHRKIMAAQVAHQTETKVWMIKLTLLHYVTTMKHIQI